MLDVGSIYGKKKAFFLGIGGISMSSLAMILKSKGCGVSGYDRSKSAVTDTLESNGIRVYTDIGESDIDSCDVIIYSAAFGESHPVMQKALAAGKPIYSRAELLGAIAAGYPNSVAVAGTHGKSTTSGMIGHVFTNAKKCDPTVVVGAVIPEEGRAFRTGSDGNFIFEACEYCDSFLSFYPTVAVVLNISLDHTDYFKDIAHIRNSFTKFMNNTVADGVSVYNLDDQNCRLAAEGVKGKKSTFSAEGDDNADYCAKNVFDESGFFGFDVYKKGEKLCSVKLSAPGKHNVSNALAAFAACDLSGLDVSEIKSGIESFKGVGRRFEYKGLLNGAKVFDDYAHHPEEIRATLSAARRLTGGKVFCVFQPHNYSRLRDLYDDFAKGKALAKMFRLHGRTLRVC